MNKFENPYAPPQSNVAAPAAAIDGDLIDATNGTRFANLIIDSICRLLFALAVGVACGLAGIDVRPMGVSFLFGLVTIFGYYVLLEGMFGFTVGKLITGTRVVALDGSKAKFGAVVGRTLSRFVPFEPFSFLGNTAGWHDRWSGTRVIRVRR
jgi:uncharacterized RDD family membrane protein YckC